MTNRRIIIIDKDTDAQLGTVCSAALKSSGIEVLPDINALINSIIEELDEDFERLDFEE